MNVFRVKKSGFDYNLVDVYSCYGERTGVIA